jgi:hypothetical protein
MICKQKRRRFPILSYLLVILYLVLSPLYAQAQTPSAPLIQSNNLSLAGTFKLPSGKLGSTYGFESAGTNGIGPYAVTYNPTNNSLFIGGHPYEQRVAEIAIPQSFSGTPTATALQNLIEPLEGKIDSINPSDSSAKILGAAFVYNSQLYLAAFSSYDANNTQTKSQFVRPTNLYTKGQVQGPFAVGNLNQSWFDKYAAIIPPEWEAAFGGPVLVGGSVGNINALQSWGPSASVIAPSDIGSKNPIPATIVLGYPMAHPLSDGFLASPLFSQADKIFGLAFPQGTRSVLFFGKHGMGAYCYGEGSACNDPADGAKGVHAYPYRSQVWAYDANDLVAVRNGQKQSWEVQPYAVWQLDSSFTDIQGVGYDPSTQRIFVSAVCEDSNCTPLIKVYQINGVTGATPPPTSATTPLSPSNLVLH